MYSELTDIELLGLLKKSDHQAFSELYNRHWERLVIVAYVKLRSEADAKEAVQTIFFEIWKRRAQLHVEQNFERWLNGALKYKILSFFSQRYQQVQRTANLPYTTESNSTEQYLDYQSLKAHIESSVAQLPTQCRMVYRLSREEGLSLPEIAETLQISPKTAEAHLTKALKRLRASLDLFHCFL